MNGLEVSVRFIHLASVLLLVGIFGFDLLVGRPPLRAAAAETAPAFQSFFKAPNCPCEFIPGDRHRHCRTVYQNRHCDGIIVVRIIGSRRYRERSVRNAVRNSLACPNGSPMFARSHDGGPPLRPFQKRFSLASHCRVRSERDGIDGAGRVRSCISG